MLNEQTFICVNVYIIRKFDVYFITILGESMYGFFFMYTHVLVFCHFHWKLYNHGWFFCQRPNDSIEKEFNCKFLLFFDLCLLNIFTLGSFFKFRNILLNMSFDLNNFNVLCMFTILEIKYNEYLSRSKIHLTMIRY